MGGKDRGSWEYGLGGEEGGGNYSQEVKFKKRKIKKEIEKKSKKKKVHDSWEAGRQFLDIYSLALTTNFSPPVSFPEL